MAEESFDILLIEDNDADAVLIERYLERIDRVLLPQEPVFRRAPSLSEGFDELKKTDADLVLLDLGLPGHSGIDTLRSFFDRHEDVPVVVLTGLDEQETAVRAISEGAQDYLNKDEIDVQGLGRALRYAVERVKLKEKSDRQKTLRRMLQEILVESSTREEIETRFCEGLTEQGPYTFAWIGSPESENTGVPRASSGGGDGYPGVLTEPEATEQDYEVSVRAGRSGEPSFVNSIKAGGKEGWRSEALDRGLVSAAAFPLRYSGVSYGVLSVYSDTTDFFDGIEKEVLTEVSDSLSYSLNMVDKETALLSGDTTEVRIEIDGPVTYLNGLYGSLRSQSDEVTVSVRGTFPTEEGHLQFVDIRGVSPDAVMDSALSASAVEEAEVIHEYGSGGRYQFKTSAETPERFLTDIGLILRSTEVFTDGVSVRVGVPPNKNVNEVLEKTESNFGSARMVMHMRDSGGKGRKLYFDSETLTDKQMEAVKMAYYRGYFEQPKKNSAEEVADALNVSRSTFLQHLRTAQKKVFGGLFGEVSVDDS